MFSDSYSSELPENIALAFQSLYARLRTFTAVSFNEDGTLIPASADAGIVPIGGSILWHSDVIPAKWLLCDGTAISRVTYKELFAIIGVAYGVGDGSTTFNVPDYRQRFPLGKAIAGTGNTLGATGGAIDHTHTGPSHTHALTAAGTSTTGAHTHSGATGGTAPGTDSQGSHNHTGATGSHTHTFTTGGPSSLTSDVYQATVGGGLQVPGLVHTHSGTTDGSTASISADGSHSHTVNSHTHTIGSDGNHSHTLTGSTDAGGTGNTSAANPPFLVQHFIILAGV